MNIVRRGLSLAISGLITLTVFAQKTEIPKGWHLLNPKDSGFYGISLAEAYDFVSTKKLKSSPVIVAVIDSGVDTLHEDLKTVLWKNPKEIPGNGIDDDRNGYVDDVYGWNFLGGRDGRNVEKDTYESARVYHNFKSKYEGKEIDEDKLSPEERKEYRMWLRAKAEAGSANSYDDIDNLIRVRKALKNAIAGDSILKPKLKENYTAKDVDMYYPTDDEGKRAKRYVLTLYRGFDIDFEQPVADVIEEIKEYVATEESKAKAADAKPTPYRDEIVKDNYQDFNDKFYGNSNVMVSKPAALHGTHVCGIIGAARGNGLGVDGIADNVKIMMLRAVPDGDEHDKDIALAIRYAVDNGAKVVNMSFGKPYSPEKKWVDDAVKYAESKGVLLVHAAGNSNEDIDKNWNFPTPVFEDEKRATNWITVGASGPKADIKAGGLTASFSNYGKKEVDVFAPGVRIYSTVPGGNTYQNLQGTSMASPVVAGLAAFIMEYYPSLSAKQVKMVIEKSAQNPGVKVKIPGTSEQADLSEISKSGGIINAYEAIKLASTIKGELKPGSPAKRVKSTVKPKLKA